ncbi:hypothetical protein ASPWEDRAFT_176492 [Aspergillus wentii DTO 134E9]|uniref:Uncharacterized protein n=1 Tax=Aspergillus wentii DTO 134E9 TaxID=1073089 RepID=A0A1L9R980_ASPWE|nr:uncharacterized protein ASPWEDRAFT_176492 [Aspergillus wentii DTO 134E9]KAI9926536.1 hypothetical protein MW887_004304 [Aspergillus wentii]OJJ31417.1 hypothetical protein ASPWEDRAFT_176492 [Aspergillus wentii DTO 134E9]
MLRDKPSEIAEILQDNGAVVEVKSQHTQRKKFFTKRPVASRNTTIASSPRASAQPLEPPITGPSAMAFSPAASSTTSVQPNQPAAGMLLSPALSVQSLPIISAESPYSMSVASHRTDARSTPSWSNIPLSPPTMGSPDISLQS